MKEQQPVVDALNAIAQALQEVKTELHRIWAQGEPHYVAGYDPAEENTD